MHIASKSIRRGYAEKTSATGGNTLAAPPPLNQKKICNDRFCWPANFLQEYPRIVTLARTAPEIKPFQNKWYKKKFQKNQHSQIGHSLDYLSNIVNNVIR